MVHQGVHLRARLSKELPRTATLMKVSHCHTPVISPQQPLRRELSAGGGDCPSCSEGGPGSARAGLTGYLAADGRIEYVHKASTWSRRLSYFLSLARSLSQSGETGAHERACKPRTGGMNTGCWHLHRFSNISPHRSVWAHDRHLALLLLSE